MTVNGPVCSNWGVFDSKWINYSYFAMLCAKTTVFHLSKAFSLLPVLIYGFFCIAWINTKNEILSGRTSSVCSESTNVWLFYLDSSSRTQLQAPFNFLCLPCLKVISVQISVIMHTQSHIWAFPLVAPNKAVYCSDHGTTDHPSKLNLLLFCHYLEKISFSNFINPSKNVNISSKNVHPCNVYWNRITANCPSFSGFKPL